MEISRILYKVQVSLFSKYYVANNSLVLSHLTHSFLVRQVGPVQQFLVSLVGGNGRDWVYWAVKIKWTSSQTEQNNQSTIPKPPFCLSDQFKKKNSCPLCDKKYPTFTKPNDNISPHLVQVIKYHLFNPICYRFPSFPFILRSPTCPSRTDVKIKCSN